MPAISRGLSEATPPDRNSLIPQHEPGGFAATPHASRILVRIVATRVSKPTYSSIAPNPSGTFQSAAKAGRSIYGFRFLVTGVTAARSTVRERATRSIAIRQMAAAPPCRGIAKSRKRRPARFAISWKCRARKPAVDLYPQISPMFADHTRKTSSA